MRAKRQSTLAPPEEEPIKASDLIKRIQEAIDLYGDHEIVMEAWSEDGPYEKRLDDFRIRCCTNQDQTMHRLLILL